MNTVRKLLKAKDPKVWTVSKEATVFDAHELMIQHKISSVIVIENDKVIGIFTENDFVQKVGLDCKDTDTMLIETVMTKDPLTVSPDKSISDCMNLMIDNHIRHLPVMENERLIGIVSVSDVVKDLIEELEFHVEQLTNYIQGFR